jgi:DNA repair photolyase
MFVRWENLTVDEEERTRLPGYREPAVVRRFRAPEALDTRFYEIRAKSILNRVPESSRMPFRWTINPYRGCTHSCLYCQAGDTAILTADGRHKPLADLNIGDAVFGTAWDGQNRRYTATVVLDKWIVVKPAYRVTLQDGTELTASGDHRYLTDGGWKHVIGTSSLGCDRAHLTTGDDLVGTGAFAEQPAETDPYRRGYLTGVIKGDGAIGSGRYVRAGRGVGVVPRFRLAVTELEALRRARRYLAEDGAKTTEHVFQRAAGSHGEMVAIGRGEAEVVDRVRDLTDWPALPSRDWCRGFLAGIFDAQGSHGALVLRIASSDPEVLGWIVACAKRLGFDVAPDRTVDRHGLTHIGIRGGLPEHLRFFHVTDPAVTGKRSIEGQMVTALADLRVVSVEPLGRAIPLYDITTGTGDFIADGVVSHNCFARPTHTYLDFNAGRDFEREIVVKVNAPERLRVELARPSWQGEHVALGTNTDPYQWVEGRYRLMRGIWEAFRDAGNSCSVLTKSPLLLRDLDLMREINERTSFSAALSVPTLDEKAWRATEPHTPNPRARLEAVGELTRAGIETGVLIAPLMPGINDSPEQVGRIVELATEAGASFVSGIALHLRGEVRELFFAWLREHRPDLIDRYEDLYQRGAYAPVAERRRLQGLVAGPDAVPPGRTRGMARKRAPAPTPAAAPALHDPQQRLF